MSTTAQTKPKKTAAAAKKPLSHPTFAEMITEAITSLKERTGSSQYAITKFIEEKHKDLPPTYRKLVLLQLKKSVASGNLFKVKNSFKIAPSVAKTAPAKTAAKATVKPKAKAAVKPKAKAAVKPKAKAVVKPKAKSVKATPVKKAVAKKVVKKVKSVKSPAKKVKSVKTPVKKAKK
ncbi:unnamed protein product [Vicia faba]|uniref:H15 domain-containing protein n=1 Tax=Vicia faba TaxID=3906 RepID=A0AAV0ZZB4_VICFA|nr:unnamed protein product [Vicia faba]